MNTSIQKLLADIEHCRQEMVLTASRSSFLNRDVIEISMKLDDLINRYQSLSKK